MKDLLDPPKQRRSGITQGQKTLILWAILILMVIAIWNMFAPPPSSHGHQAAPQETDWSSTAWTAGVIALFGGWFFWIQRVTSRFNRANNDGIALLNKGAPAQAAEAFEALVRKYRRRNLRTIARHNAGVARLREGKLERAVELLTPVIKDKKAPNLKGSAACELASACALAGRLDEAERWLATAEKSALAKHSLVWPRALVMARRGEHAELARMLDQHWRELENTLQAELMRRLTVLRAFAVASAEGPRGAGVVEPLLARLRPATPGEYAWLTGCWPELHAFLETHQL
jgi:tetratricopeptide (TPR) repeat protein